MTDMKRGALIGCGFFAQNHMHGWADVDGAEIVAVCDLDVAKARETAAKFGVDLAFDDAEQMLQTVDLDFVDVATTPPSHRNLVELVAHFGRSVICQKPIADTFQDAKAMVAAADAAGVDFLIHENFRWELGFLELRRLIEEGRIGTPQFAHLSFRHGYDVYANQPYLAGFKRFALMDVGIHLYDVVRFLIGEVETLSCQTQSRKPGIAGEDAFTSLCRHSSGAVSVVDCSFYSKIDPDPFPQTLAWIEGDLGTAELTGDYRLNLHRDGAKETISVEPAVPRWGAKPWHAVQDSVIRFQNHVVDVLNGRSEPQPSGRDNLQTLALSLASYDAADGQCVVNMSDWLAKHS